MGRRVIIICSCLFNRTKGTRNFFLYYLDKKSAISFLTFFLTAERGGKFAFFIALTKNSTVYPLQNLFFAELDGGYVLYYIRFFDYAYATLRI